MVQVKRVVLDVLKPHHPDALEFCRHIAEIGPDYRVKLTVQEMDEKTQTLKVVVEAENIDFDSFRRSSGAWGPRCTVSTRWRWRAHRVPLNSA